MARVAFVSRAIDEAGNAVGGSAQEVRIYDDFNATIATVVTADSAGAITITQPITPNAGTWTTLSTTTAAVDTTITVASTTGFVVGQLITIFDGTNTRYRWITAILAGPARLTLESAIGVIFLNTNTQVGNLDQVGIVGGYVPDTSYHYIQVKDVASGRLMPPTLIPTMIGNSSVAVLEEGAAAGTRPTINFIGPNITAVDNAPSTRVDVTVTGPTQALFDDHSARHDPGGADVLTIAAPVTTGYANAAGTAVSYPRSDHVHAVALTTASADLGANVTMTTGGTWYDGPTVSLAAGTWLVTATLLLSAGSAGSTSANARISDGATHYASATDSSVSTGYTSLSCMALITLGSTTTIKAQGVGTNSNGTIYAATPASGSGNNASHIRAVRVA